MAGIRKIKAGLVLKTDVNSFIGEEGNIFFNPDNGDLRLSDGITPGGIPLGAGGGGGATIFRQLFDTPSTYIGSAGYFVKVKDDESGLEFVNQTIFDGDYNNLTNKPDLSIYQLAANAFSGSYNDLTDLPTLFSGSYNDLTDKPDALSVGVVDATNSLISNTTDVTAIRFDTDSGFDVVDLGSGVVKVQMNSTFKTWKSAGEQDLIATGLDVVEFIAGPGIDISLDPNGSPYQSITITNTGSADSGTGGGGGATALNDLTDVTYDPNTTFIGDRLTWDGNQWVPDADGSSSQFGGSLLGVIIDMDINSDGDLILHHVDTFSNRNAFITDEGYMIFTDGEYWESGYVLDDYVQTDF